MHLNVATPEAGSSPIITFAVRPVIAGIIIDDSDVIPSILKPPSSENEMETSTLSKGTSMGLLRFT